MFKLLQLLPFLALTLNVQAQEFSLFGESFEPTYDIKIRDLDYVRQYESGKPHGTFSFEKFKVINEHVNIELFNESHFYDADIYLEGSHVGFKGPAAQFVYKVRPEDWGYFDSFRWMKMENIHFFMNRSEISLKGKHFAMREPQTFLLASNLDLECERHPDYILNDGDGFLTGCLNYGEAKSLEGNGVGIDYKFYDKQGVNSFDLKGYFSLLRSNQESFYLETPSFTASIPEELDIDGTDATVHCAKIPDLLDMNKETVVIPCLNNLQYSASFLNLKFHPDQDETTFFAPEFKTVDSEFSAKAEKIVYKSSDTTFRSGGLDLECGYVDGDPLKSESYFKTCLSNSKIGPRKDLLPFEFIVDDKTPQEELYLDLKGDISSIEFHQEQLHILAPQMKLDIDKEVFMNFSDIRWDCQKKMGLEKFDIKEILSFCKKRMNLEVPRISIKDFSERDKPFVADVSPERGYTKDNELFLYLDKIKLVDVEDLTSLVGVKARCEILEEADVFVPNQVIAGCARNGEIIIDNVYSEDSSFKPQQIMDPRFNTRSAVVPEKKPKLKQVYIGIKDGWMNLKVRVRFLGQNLKVEMAGPVSYNMDTELLKIDVKKARLPLGIKSKGIFMYLIKKLLVTEMISFPSDNEIHIAI